MTQSPRGACWSEAWRAQLSSPTPPKQLSLLIIVASDMGFRHGSLGMAAVMLPWF